MKVITYPAVEPVSLTTAKLQCAIDPPDAAHPHDPLIELYITSAREWVEDYLGVRVAPTVVESEYSAFPSGNIELETGPVVSVASVTYLDTDGNPQTLAGSAYTLNGTLAPVSAWPTGTSVKVQYTVGYSALDDVAPVLPVPRSVIVAMLLLIAHRYRNREESTNESLQAIPMGIMDQLFGLKVRMGMA